MSFRMKIMSLWMCMIVAGGTAVEVSGASLQPETALEVEIGQQSEAAMNQAGSELFVQYVYAAQRMKPWMDYVITVSKASKEAEVLNKFQLNTLEYVQTLLEMKQKTQDELNLLQQLKKEAYVQIGNEYSWKGSAAPLIELSKLKADTKQAASLKLAQLNEKKAKRETESADILLKAGMIDTLQVLAIYEAYKQARLNTIDAKATYVLSLIDAYRAGSGSPLSLTALLALLAQEKNSELMNEWTSALDPFMKPLDSNEASGVSKQTKQPSYQIKAGVVYVPLRPYTDRLGYQVRWDKLTGDFQLSNEAEQMVIAPKQQRLFKNEQSFLLAAVPYIQNNYTYVPLSFFSDVFGIEVIWSEPNQQVLKISPRMGEEG